MCLYVFVKGGDVFICIWSLQIRPVHSHLFSSTEFVFVLSCKHDWCSRCPRRFFCPCPMSVLCVCVSSMCVCLCVCPCPMSVLERPPPHPVFSADTLWNSLHTQIWLFLCREKIDVIMHVCRYTHMHMDTHVYIHAHGYTWRYLFIFIYVQMCVYICIYIHVYVNVYMRIHKSSSIFIHTYRCMSTYSLSLPLSRSLVLALSLFSSLYIHIYTCIRAHTHTQVPWTCSLYHPYVHLHI